MHKTILLSDNTRSPDLLCLRGAQGACVVAAIDRLAQAYTLFFYPFVASHVFEFVERKATVASLLFLYSTCSFGYVGIRQ